MGQNDRNNRTTPTPEAETVIQGVGKRVTGSTKENVTTKGWMSRILYLRPFLISIIIYFNDDFPPGDKKKKRFYNTSSLNPFAGCGMDDKILRPGD